MTTRIFRVVNPHDKDEARRVKAQIAAAVAVARAPEYIRGISPARRTNSAPVRLPCVHEGPILQWCATCGGARAELRHVRVCECEANEASRCTRGPNGGGDADIASCAACAFWEGA